MRNPIVIDPIADFEAAPQRYFAAAVRNMVVVRLDRDRSSQVATIVEMKICGRPAPSLCRQSRSKPSRPY
jgi:hypothetical protein